MLEEAILATDLALYFKNRAQFLKIVESEDYEALFGTPQSGTHAVVEPDHSRSLLRGMLMTACDIAGKWLQTTYCSVTLCGMCFARVT